MSEDKTHWVNVKDSLADIRGVADELGLMMIPYSEDAVFWQTIDAKFELHFQPPCGPHIVVSLPWKDIKGGCVNAEYLVRQLRYKVAEMEARHAIIAMARHE